MPSWRIDARNHITGTIKFALDMDVTGAKPTAVVRAPQVRRHKVVRRGGPACHAGLIDVARIPTGVSIRAEMFGQALDAQKATRASYDKWEVP